MPWCCGGQPNLSHLEGESSYPFTCMYAHNLMFHWRKTYIFGSLLRAMMDPNTLSLDSPYNHDTPAPLGRAARLSSTPNCLSAWFLFQSRLNPHLLRRVLVVKMWCLVREEIRSISVMDQRNKKSLESFWGDRKDWRFVTSNNQEWNWLITTLVSSLCMYNRIKSPEEEVLNI